MALGSYAAIRLHSYTAAQLTHKLGDIRVDMAGTRALDGPRWP